MTVPLRQPDTLPAILVSIRDAMIEEGGGCSAADLNTGRCEEFAGRAERLAPGVEAIGFGNLMNHDTSKNECCFDATGFDPAVLDHFPAWQPPGMSWAALFPHVDDGIHIWAYSADTGKVYDAECTEGTDNIFDLPFFQRFMRALQQTLEPKDASHPPSATSPCGPSPRKFEFSN